MKTDTRHRLSLPTYHLAGVSINLIDAQRTIILAYNTVTISMHLSPTQFVILKTLLQHSKHHHVQIVSLEDIVDALGWQRFSGIEQKTNLQKQISNLRHRLRPHLRIMTIHDEYELLGYSLAQAWHEEQAADSRQWSDPSPEKEEDIIVLGN